MEQYTITEDGKLQEILPPTPIIYDINDLLSEKGTLEGQIAERQTKLDNVNAKITAYNNLS